MEADDVFERAKDPAVARGENRLGTLLRDGHPRATSP